MSIEQKTVVGKFLIIYENRMIFLVLDLIITIKKSREVLKE
jgi:hypothetical protein